MKDGGWRERAGGIELEVAVDGRCRAGDSEQMAVTGEGEELGD